MAAASPTPALELRDLAFTYAGNERPAVAGVSLAVPVGAVALLVGPTGSGKSTLLSLAKPELAPAGTLAGELLVFGRPPAELGPAESARTVGHVGQVPENQVVCDEVASELAFGLESLGTPAAKTRQRVAETCTCLGLGPWYHARTSELSAGRLQLLALAATLVMRPRLLLLDEPASQLDPLAARELAALVVRANRELGVTVVVATHAPELFAADADLAFALPAPARPEGVAEGAASCSLTCVSGGQVAGAWGPVVRRPPGTGPDPGRPSDPPQAAQAGGAPAVGDPAREGTPAAHAPADAGPGSYAPSVSLAADKPCVTVRDLWFRHFRGAPWVLSGLDLAVARGEVRALLGGNGAGKTTLLRLVAGALRPARGRVRSAAAASQAYLPARPQALFSCETVREELLEWAPAGDYGLAGAAALLEGLGLPCDAGLLERHPHDLSGGQAQLLALAKLLLVRPRLLLLDEPAKGLDARARSAVAAALARAGADGATVIVATHDLALVSAAAHSATLLFDGQAALTEPAAAYLAGAWLWGRP